jgi:hypothetical protein
MKQTAVELSIAKIKELQSNKKYILMYLNNNNLNHSLCNKYSILDLISTSAV